MENKEIIVNIESLLNSEIGTRSSEKINIEEEFADENLKVRNLRGEVELTNLGDRLLADLNLEARINSECSRCLKEFILGLKISHPQEYSYQSGEEIFPINPNKTIDLWPSIRQEIILAIPVKPLCDERCKGITINKLPNPR